MLYSLQHPPASLDTLRICIRVAWEEHVCLAPFASLYEEATDPHYQGFGRWSRKRYTPLAIERILLVQRDLRLCISLQDDEFAFCDISQDEVTTDLFGLFADASDGEDVLWEYVPHDDLFRRVTLPASLRIRLAQELEESLFD